MATKLGTLTLDLVARIGSFTQGMNQASTTAEREMRRVENSVVTVDSLIKKLAVTAGAAFSVSQIVNYADSYTGMVNKLKLVTEGQSQLSVAMADTHKIAQSTASDWGSVVDVYTKFQKISEKLGLSQNDVARITETVTKAVAISGASADDAQRSLVQFSQALSLGVLRGQDLNSVMSQTPGLTDAIAKGMGVTSDKLKQMGTDGILSTQKVVEALQKVASSTDKDFAETATTVAASFSLIKNEAIKMVGEFDGATGASKTFVQGMTLLSENMDVVTKAAGLMAAVYAGKVVSGYAASMVASAQQRAALTAEQAANVQLLGVQVQRARQNVALALTEVNLARADYNAATSAMARAAANQRLITANIALSIADKQATAATAAYTVASTAAAGATTRLAAAKAMLARVGTGLLGALGGPVGLAVMLATVAAGYLLTRNSTEESTKSLRENNDSVGDAIKKYKELDEVKRRSQLVTEKESLRDLAGEYDNINTKLITATYSLSRHNDMTTEQSKEVNALVAEYKKTGNIEDFSSKINNLTTVNQASKDGFNKLAGEVKGAGDQFKNQKTFVDQLAPSVKNVGDQAKKTAVEVADLSEEIKKLLGQADKNIENSRIASALATRGYSDEMITLAQKYLAVEGAIVKNEQGRWALRPDLQKKLTEEYGALQKQKTAIDARNEAEKKVTSEKEKQAKLDEKKYQYSTAELKMLQKVAELSAKADLDTIGSKYGIPKNYLAGLMAQESKGDPNAVSPTGAIGYFQTTAAYRKDNGISVADSKNLPVIAEVVSKNLAKAYKELGNWEAAIRSHNAGLTGSKQFEDNGRVNGSAARNKEVANFSSSVNKWIVGLGGSDLKAKGTTDSIGDLKEYLDFLKEQAAKQKEIELVGASEIIKIRSKLADDIKEIEQAGFSPERTTELKAEYQKRADIDIQIAEAAHSDKLSGYSDYMKTEEQLLNESYARRQRDLKFDLDNSSDEYTAASLALEDQRKREVETIRRDQKLDILQTKRDWMDKGKWAEEYYALIREEILSTQSYSPEMKDAKIKEVNFNQGMEQNAEREGVWSDYKSMMGLDDSPYKQDMDLLAEARAQMLITEEEYQQQRLAMQLSYGSQYGADFAGMMMGLVDSSSSAYAILGSIQKGAALFSTAMNSYTAISAAWASAPFPYNLPAVGMATMETGLLQAAVSALSPVGFADGGYTGDGGKYTIGGIVHKGEGVLTQEEIAALGGPSGFYALRQSIKNGFSEGGLVLDPPRVLNPSQNSEIKKAMDQVQSNNSQSPQVNLNPNFTFVDERENPHDYMYGSNGEKAVMRILKRNGVV